MRIERDKVANHNDRHLSLHTKKLNALTSTLQNTESILEKLIDFQVAIPSWALGTGGTRFGRFAGAGEPGNLQEKIEDIESQLSELN